MPLNRITSPMSALGGGLVDIVLKYDGDASADLTLDSSCKGASSSITESGTGGYSVVLDGAGGVDIIGVQLSVLSAANKNVMVESITESTRTIVLQGYDADAGTDIGIVNGESIFMRVTVRNTAAVNV